MARREVSHKFSAQQVRLIRYARARWKWTYEEIAARYPEIFVKRTNAKERAELVELVIKGVIGAADDQMCEVPAPPTPNSPKSRELVPKRCTEGHRYHREVCFHCYVAALPKPDAEAAEVL